MKAQPTLRKGTILVTGGAGFIGSALIWALNKMGREDIIVTDFLGKDEKFKNLIPLRFFDYIEADDLLSRVTSESDTLNDITTVLHMGACSATTEKDARYLIQNNYEYTKTLAQWCLKRNIRFIYASSAATYGDGSAGMNDLIPNLNALQPLNMYGYSKHLFDQYALKNGWLKKIVGLKFFNVFGPNEYHKEDMRSVVVKAFEQISSEGKVRLFKSYHPDYPDGGQRRDFLYVKDCVKMTLHLAAEEKAHGLYNLGNGISRTWIDLVTPIFKALNKPVEIEFIDMPESLKPKYQYFTQAKIENLRTTGYTETLTSLEDAVDDYVTHYLIGHRYLGQE
jgi:ADP-L-glycero-D-manno-heptose 6-epimerase